MFNPILLPVRRPLLSLSACAALSDRSMVDLLRRVEDGRLVAFDLATSQSSARRLLRILSKSMAAEMGNGPRPKAETPAQLLAEIAEFVPALSATIRSESLQRLFSIEHQHVHQLARARHLEVARYGRRGRGGSTLFSISSCVQFLAARHVK